MAYNALTLLQITDFFHQGRTLEQLDELFGDQIVPHALKDPQAAEEAMNRKFSVSSDVQGVIDVHEDKMKV